MSSGIGLINDIEILGSGSPAIPLQSKPLIKDIRARQEGTNLKVAATIAFAFLMIAASTVQAQDALSQGVPVTGPFSAPSKDTNPLDHLPPQTRLLVDFGERPVFSPDGTKVAFVQQAYGQVFEYNLITKSMRNLTAHTPNNGFLRVHYMRDGSYLLLAPRRMAASREETRNGHVELWWMDSKAEGQIVNLGQTVFEGIAVSTTSNRIAWGVISPRFGKLPNGIGGKTTLMTASIEMSDGAPKIVDARPLVTRNWESCLLEGQDFFNNDRLLTATCYVMNTLKRPGAKPVEQAQVYTIDTTSGNMVHIPTPIELYAEVEGVFPGGRHTLVECSNDQSKGLDLCLLELKPVNPVYKRITFAQDYGDYRFSNPQVSKDGKHIVFQIGLAAEDAGSGRGVLMMDVPAGF